jgi:Protein of unknown function (DUF3443)
VRKLRAVAVFGVLSLTLACGGGSGNSGGGGGGGGGSVPGCTVGTGRSASGNPIAVSAPNVATITVDGGLPNIPYLNGVFTTVRVCVHGTANCQNIDHVLVDTGSYGLRLLSNSGGGELTAALSAALPLEHDSNAPANIVAECAQFSDGITWGPLKFADIYVGGPTPGAGESAKTNPGSGSLGMPVQIIGDPGFATVPSACTSFGTPEDTLSTLFANGIIGVGPFPQDCGDACNLGVGTGGNPGFYYSCPSGGCSAGTQPAAEAVAAQVWNPVAAFAPLTAGAMADNNGDILELPTVPATGLAVNNGSLVFGIGTQNNNGLGNIAVYTGDASANITTNFGGQTFSNSFIDSGSNGYFFNFPSANVNQCGSNPGFYCPEDANSNPESLSCSATNIGKNNKSGTIAFGVINLDHFTGPANVSALNGVAGPNNPSPGSSGPTGFDWGLPFFYGRNVYTGMIPTAGVTSAPPGVPTGPFFAY